MRLAAIIAGSLLLAAGTFGTASAAWAGTSGLCRIVEPGGAKVMRRWAGSCRGGLADGHGAGPMRTGDEAGVFAGRASNGRPVSGVTTLPDGAFLMLAPERADPPPGMDAAAMASELAFKDAFAGAAEAARAYRAVGNAASARYYADLRKRLISGQPE